MFDKSKNVIDEEDIPYEDAVDWRIGVDYGTGNATVFELGFMDSKGKIYIIDEYYFAGRLEAQAENDYSAQKTDQEYADDMKLFINKHYNTTGRTYREIQIVVDPAAASFKLTLRRMHMKTKNAINDVINGIRTVSTFLQSDSLYISSKCEMLIDEIQTYVWDTKKQEQGVDSPKKVNDHAVDALRYLVMSMARKTDMSKIAINAGI